jgi:hypothetical protein
MKSEIANYVSDVILARNQSKPLKGRWYSATIANTLVEIG